MADLSQRAVEELFRRLRSRKMAHIVDIFIGILQDVDDLARKVLLPVQEVKWHLDHCRQILERRKEVQKKASKKRTQKNDSLEDSGIGACITCNEKADLICSADACNDRYCLDCLGLSYPPPMKWICPQCQDETELYCLCNQGEYGLMVGCDGKECSIEWFHVQCVGLKGKPKAKKWLCPLCKR